MKRRGFIGALAAAGVGMFLPSLPAAAPHTEVPRRRGPVTSKQMAGLINTRIDKKLISTLEANFVNASFSQRR